MVNGGLGLTIGSTVVIGIVGVVARWRQGSGFARRHLVIGVVLVGLGLALRFGVAAANDGVVPTTTDALRTAGQATVTVEGQTVPELVEQRFWALGDLLAWPAPLPLATPFGPSHLLVLAGVWMAVRPPRPTPERRRLAVADGRLWCEGTVAGSAGVEVQVPGATLQAVSASFGVEVGPRGGVVIVVDGSVDVVTERASLRVPARHGLALLADGAAGSPEPLAAEELGADPWVAPHLATIERRRRGGRRRTPPAPARRVPVGGGILAGSVLATVVALTYLVQVLVVPSGSMEPTYRDGDRLVVAKAVTAPAVGDVVVFERPPEVIDGPLLLVKRVVAVGGQEVRVEGGIVTVDGELRVEPPVGGAATPEPCGAVGTVRVPSGAVFVLGDNRDDSLDSRCFGPVAGAGLVGSVVGRPWPLTR